MRRFLAILCMLLMCLSAASAEKLAGEMFPADETAFSGDLAREALALSMLSDAASARAALRAEGFEILLQKHYDKAQDNLSDTCAFTVGRKTVMFAGAERTLMLVTVRGTGAGEWYSNFDVGLPENPDYPYAKGFYVAARDVIDYFAPLYEAESAPLVLVTGYSRGAACANLVGLLLNEQYGGAGVYVYTFATPRTVRDEAARENNPNIFNIVYETDIVTNLPLAAWGFERAGTDIVLPGKAAEIKRTQNALDIMLTITPDLDAYYNLTHSLSAPGASADGVSTFMFMTGLIDSLMGMFTGDQLGDTLTDMMKMIQSKSDYTPFLTLLLSLSLNDAALFKGVGTRHMPDTYAAQLEKYLAK